MPGLRSFARLLCSGALVALACDAGSPAARAPAAGAVPVPAASRVAASGRVEGWREADVASKLPGRVLRFAYEEGDTIEAGATVVQLEDRDLRTRVRAAEVRAREAKRELVRLRALRERGVAAQAELDRAESDSLARVAELDEARVLLDYASIEAPFRGVLVRRFKEIGESVSTTNGPDPLFRIADLSRLKVTAEVPENDIASIGVGQRARITTPAYPGASFAARVHRVGLAVGRKKLRSDDPRERLLEKVVEVELELPGDPRLKSGMTVDIVFPLESTALASRPPRLLARGSPTGVRLPRRPRRR
jgi:RND family efflux transporter MFP subunit